MSCRRLAELASTEEDEMIKAVWPVWVDECLKETRNQLFAKHFGQLRNLYVDCIFGTWETTLVSE